jgi:DNA-binding NarL/FixJ family response regulator
VLQLLARGHTNREIAELFALSVKTVETYRARLRDKLGLRRRADLVRFAISLGLLDSVPAKNKATRRNAVRPTAAPPRP